MFAFPSKWEKKGFSDTVELVLDIIQFFEPGTPFLKLTILTDAS
jgi:hypothetical protein